MSDQPPNAPYYRPDPGGTNPGDPHPADKPIGIVIMVLSVCCLGGGIALAAGIGAMGAMAGGAAAQGGQGSQDAAVAAGMMGLGAAVLGVVTAVFGALGIATGYGIMKSAKWGFILGSVVYGLNTLLNVLSIASQGAQSIIGLAISGALFAFCFMRLTGKLGAPPA